LLLDQGSSTLFQSTLLSRQRLLASSEVVAYLRKGRSIGILTPLGCFQIGLLSVESLAFFLLPFSL
jgi:hypothetical protein